MPEIKGVSLPFIPAGGVEELKRKPLPTGANRDIASFEEVFNKELNKLKFSSHAQSRMVSRNLSLDDSELQSLNSAVSRAEEKGAKDTLVILNEMAFIVNIPNKTVITAVSRDKLESSVVTNIDSVVLSK